MASRCEDYAVDVGNAFMAPCVLCVVLAWTGSLEEEEVSR